MRTSEEVKKFQEAGVKLAERQVRAVKPPLEPSSLAKKVAAEQKPHDKSDATE